MIRSRTTTTALRTAARSLAAPSSSTSSSSFFSTTTTTATRTAPSPSTTIIVPTRPFSSQPHHDGHHDHHDHHAPEPTYDPPTGWLWGVRPGETPEREGWEIPMVLFVASIAAFGVALAFRPNERLDTWALEEARRRLEKEGLLEDPFPEGPKKA